MEINLAVRGHPAEAIVQNAESEGVQLIVLGQHGHSRIKRFFLGSTSDRVSEHCHCTVMIGKWQRLPEERAGPFPENCRSGGDRWSVRQERVPG